jgi:hypothetical protein
MVASTMLPEAHDEGGSLTALVTAAGSSSRSCSAVPAEVVHPGRSPFVLIVDAGGPRRLGLTGSDPMPSYLALTYTADVDWTEPEQAAELAEYREFMAAAGTVVRGGKALYPTATATTVRVAGGKGGDVLTTDGPYAETKEALTGYYVLECADLDEAVRVAAKLPAAWNGAVEVRPIIDFGG